MSCLVQLEQQQCSYLLRHAATSRLLQPKNVAGVLLQQLVACQELVSHHMHVWLLHHVLVERCLPHIYQQPS